MAEDYTDSTYGDRIAEVYDDRYERPFEPDTTAAVAFLASLAAGGPALELGIGTGRVALPLAAGGVEVHGIDASEAMVAKLRAKPGGDAVPVTIGTFADFTLPASYPLVYVTFNTFFSLLEQGEQIAAFAAVARHLTPGGVFVMQAFVPDTTRFDVHDQRVAVDTITVNEVTIETAVHDPFAQRIDAHYVVIRDGSIRTYPVRIRYAHVPELDLMATMAGLRLRERWSDWGRTPYPASTWAHISVWERPA